VIAESLFDSVLEIEEKAYGDENTRLVDVLENLGEVLRAEGKLLRQKRRTQERSLSWRRVSAQTISDSTCPSKRWLN
jgi:hypothetical protein